MTTLVGALSMTVMATAKEGKSIKVCESYIKQTKSFKKTMGNDKVSLETLAFYKEKMLVHCGNIASKRKFEKKSFLKMMMKDGKTTTAECKMAIDMASKYSETPEQEALIVAAHKENIVDKCGTLVASHVSSYCLYDEAEAK